MRKRQRRISRRLANECRGDDGKQPVISAKPQIEMADRVTATKAGGVAAIHTMAQRLGLPELIDDRLRLLKRHLPYHESDHVLSVAYNVLAGGTCLQDLDLLREDEAFMDMLGAKRLPDPTTSGDFMRRFDERAIGDLQRGLNEIRVKVWTAQPKEFRRRAVIDIDGTVADTTGEKKADMDFNFHKKLWGYHPLLVSLANTREPLFLINRPGNVPSHTGAAPVIDEAIALVAPVFDEVLIRGDTDFSLTVNFDRWTEAGVKFVLGYDAKPNLIQIANELLPAEWKPLHRAPKYEASTVRARRGNVKEERVVEKGWKNLLLLGEEFAEFEYRPVKCARSYRMIVLRKDIEERSGQTVLIRGYRYFFYVTNDADLTPIEVIRESNDRCDQENLIEQLKDGVNAMRMPTHDLVSNWAYMVIAALAWTLKAWFGLTLSRTQDRHAVVRMEFRRFRNTVVLIPAQVLRSGRRLIVRLLAYSAGVRLVLRSRATTSFAFA